jgi:hypothetical protein
MAHQRRWRKQAGGNENEKWHHGESGWHHHGEKRQA